MSAPLHTRLAGPEDSPRIVSLLNQVFRVPTDVATWDWYAYGNPHGTSRVYLAVDDHAGELAGIFSCTPMPFHAGGRKVSGSSAHHLALAPPYRGGAPFVAMSRAMLAGEADHNVDLVIGIPNLKSYEPQKKMMKWRDFGYLDCLARMSPEVRAHNCSPVESFCEASFGVFFREAARPLDFYLEKSAAWMNWRYFGRPHNPYSVYTYSPGGVLRGYVALKRWQDPDGYRKAHIIDLHALDEEAFDQLLAGAESYAQGCNELNVWAVQQYRYRPCFEKAGFQPRGRQPVIARSREGFDGGFPQGPASLAYADADFQY